MKLAQVRVNIKPLFSTASSIKLVLTVINVTCYQGSVQNQIIRKTEFNNFWCIYVMCSNNYILQRPNTGNCHINGELQSALTLPTVIIFNGG